MNKNRLGCDDRTCIEIELSNKEADLIEKISGMIKEELTHTCMPTLSIEEIE